ncbi:hypothetical protein CCR95_08785 [Thiocystis minor]|nr:hypothetical protein [Thiocystis minor]
MANRAKDAASLDRVNDAVLLESSASRGARISSAIFELILTNKRRGLRPLNTVDLHRTLAWRQIESIMLANDFQKKLDQEHIVAFIDAIWADRTIH